MTCTIVAYSAQHTEPLRHLYRRARQGAFTGQNPAELELLDFDRATQGESLLVALHGQVPVGFVAWWPPDCFIHSLFIDPSWQGRGTGRLLLRACLAHIGRPATLKCLLSNAKALRFYQTQGWVVAGTGDAADGPYYLLSFG